MQTVRLLNTGSLLELSRRLRAAGGENIRQSMHRRIRRAAEPLKSDLQGSIRGLDIRGEGRRPGKRGGPSPTTRPLRASIADAIRISVRAGASPGATVWIDRARLPSDIPMGLVNRIHDGRIRHPVYGNRRRWTQQNATPLWWDRVVRAHQPRINREIERIVDDVRRHLE